MKLYEFVQHFGGEIFIMIYDTDLNLLMQGTAKELNTNCDKSFNMFNGFNCEVWEMTVVTWGVKDNTAKVCIMK